MTEEKKLPIRKFTVITCQDCKNIFYAKNCEVKNGRKYCSRACLMRSRRKSTYIQCSNCENTFRVAPWQIKDGIKSCSRKCQSISQITQVTIDCLICKKKFKAKPSQLEKGKKCCSRKCYATSRKGIKTWNTGKRCIEFSIRQTGDRNPNWQGGKTPLNRRIRQSMKYYEWTKAVKERDNYICQICGNSNSRQANHIKKFSDYPELRFDLANGITLCKSCHNSTVTHHEPEWESYFKFNLMARGFLNE